MNKRIHLLPIVLLISAVSTGCATRVDAKKDSELAASQEHITKLEDKVAELETRLTALNDKINLEDDAKPHTAPSAELPTEKIQPAAAAKNAAIPPVKVAAKPSKFAESFQQNEGTDRYREAKILFDSKRPADAILEFSEFIKDNPHHTLAPNAQYYIGASYLQQKEYKLAEEELSRVLLNYPHSNAIPDTLAALVKVSGNLNKPARVNYFKEKLNSHFANSPQAKALGNIKSETPSAPPAATETAKPKEELDAPAPKETVKTIAERAVKKPTAPEPPTAPVPEMSAEDSHGFEPAVIKNSAKEED